ncbi:MAG TPA: 5-oxoprolinase subunit PxpB [Syntrophorhabdaceae bacterium]|nr:5-oxoprolinase subunit PxpB [Syntrophorhabdaceae bacterium]HPP42296.1 5-oxoprolinase subunit PxpB [Syntrophorhabdaceae bacterium]
MNSKKCMEYLRYGECGIRIVFGDTIDPAINSRVINYYRHLKSKEITGIIDIVPSFNACLIIFDNTQIEFLRLLNTLRENEAEAVSPIESKPQIHEIPVRYGGEYGPDMGFVSSYTGLSEKEIVHIHASTVYTVYTIGFIPGFPYLGVLDKRLFVPRLTTPRTSVPAGSVGLAQLQTGIYTFESPGGWQIIGRTDMRLFDYNNPPYSLLQTGDRVRFIPV